MVSRIEHSVRVPVPPDVAFDAFCRLERLLQRGIYDEACWVEGKPWQVGSRIRYSVTTPIRVTISAVVTSCIPAQSVGLLNHALGITVEQYANFDRDTRGGTRVRMTMEFVGKSPELSDEAVHQTITFLTRDALDTMAALCEQGGASLASGA